jgi:hypothetical protein
MQTPIETKFKLAETSEIAAGVIEHQSTLRGFVTQSHGGFAAYCSIAPARGVIALGVFRSRREAAAAIVDVL